MSFAPLIIILIISINSSFAEAKNRCTDAIQKHLSEAIEYNKSVTGRYSELSNGKSRPLSLSLITLEKISKLLVKNIEEEAELFRKNGIPLLCEELGDMRDVPVFQDRLPKVLRPLSYFQYDYFSLDQNLEKLMKEDKIDEAYEALALDLQKLEEHPNQKCLTRHFLESMAKTLKLSAAHRDEARKLGLPDPLYVVKKFISIQRRALVLTNFLDKKAFPLQQEGLMIYCQDIPVINWR